MATVVEKKTAHAGASFGAANDALVVTAQFSIAILASLSE
jgi:hypothetical protein